MNTENNILLAEFIGGKYNGQVSFYLDNNEIWLPKFGICNYKNKFGKSLDFDTDWNWLMEVVEKIESLHYTVNISSSMIYINGNNGTVVKPINIYSENGQTKIKTVYDACVEFIKWYKKQNNEK